MTKTFKPPPGVMTSVGPNVLEQQKDFLRYARGHVRGVARRARFASVFVAVVAVLVTGGVATYAVLNTLAVRDAVARQVSDERADFLRTLTANRDQLNQLVTDNVGRAKEDAKTFEELRQALAKLQTAADSLTDAYAVISHEQAQILGAIDATKKRIESAQSTADRALKAADEAQAVAAKAALPLEQVARIADAQRTVERAVQLARTDLGEIQSSLTLIQESKERGLPRLAAILEEAEVARARLSGLVRDAAGLRDTMLVPTQQSAATDTPAWPDRKEASRAQ